MRGPATWALDRYPIRLADDGRIEVDITRRYAHRRGEWSRDYAFLEL